MIVRVPYRQPNDGTKSNRSRTFVNRLVLKNGQRCTGNNGFPKNNDQLKTKLNFQDSFVAVITYRYICSVIFSGVFKG